MVSTYMTAYQALKMTLEPEEKKGSKPFGGKKVLVVGGTGPVGQALVQLALKAGADEVFATGPQSRHRYMKMVMGANPLPYETEEWLPEVKGRMDLVFDGACQDGYESSHAALNENGKLVTVGMYAKLHAEQPGLFGAPLSAFMMEGWANMFMSKTQSYEVWSSFKKDPETFKVRGEPCLKYIGFMTIFKDVANSFLIITSNRRIWRSSLISSRRIRFIP
jgi:NADPH:quinone reductase-like Zn-dependent oxidoreductase